MSKIKAWLIGLGALITLLAATYGINRLVSQTEPVQTTKETPASTIEESNAALSMIGQPLPDFTVYAPSGETIESSSFHDKPILIMEWASWCIYCQEQMPIVQKIFNTYGEQVNFALINATGFNGETKEAAQQYMEEKGYNLPWYVDPDMKTAGLLKTNSTPTIYIVDKNQTIKTVFNSVQTEETITAALEAVLN